MREFILFTISGLTTGSVYAIIASGLTLTYATTGVFNFAHGAIAMVAAFVFWQLHEAWQWPTLLAAVLVVAVAAPVFGLAIERVVMRRLEGASTVNTLVATAALMLALVAFALWVWDPDVNRGIRPFWSGRALEVGAVRLPYHDLAVLSIALVVALLLGWFLHRTRDGIAMRARVDNPALAAINGARPQRSAQLAWVLGVSSAALAGILVAPKLTLSPLPLTLLVVNAYAAAVIGGLRSLPVTVAGALLLGLANDYMIGYLPKIDTGQQYLRGLATVTPVVVLFAALLVVGRRAPMATARGSTRITTVRPTYAQAAALGAGAVLVTIAFAGVLGVGDLFITTRVWGLAIVALSAVPLIGLAGKISLCQMTFGGIGAVVAGHLGAAGNPLALAVAAAVAGAVGAVVAVPTRRLSGIYLALATAAFAVAMDRWMFGLPRFTVFGRDVQLFRTGALDLRRPRLGPVDLASDRAYLVASAVAFGACALLVVAVVRSRLGRRLVALRDSERGAASVGVDTGAVTVGVFAGSAALAGFGGALYGMAVGSVSADRFGFLVSVSIVLTMVVAGVQTPLAAAFTGVFLAGPTLTNLFPHLSQLTSMTIALAAIGIGRNANGFIVDGLGPWWRRARGRPFVLLAGGAALAGLWIGRIGGALRNAPWAIASLALLVAAAAVAGRRDALVEALDRGSTPDDRNPVERWGVDDAYQAADIEWLDQQLALRNAVAGAAAR